MGIAPYDFTRNIQHRTRHLRSLTCILRHVIFAPIRNIYSRTGRCGHRPLQRHFNYKLQGTMPTSSRRTYVNNQPSISSKFLMPQRFFLHKFFLGCEVSVQQHPEHNGERNNRHPNCASRKNIAENRADNRAGYKEKQHF